MKRFILVLLALMFTVPAIAQVTPVTAPAVPFDASVFRQALRDKLPSLQTEITASGNRNEAEKACGVKVFSAIAEMAYSASPLTKEEAQQWGTAQTKAVKLCFTEAMPPVPAADQQVVPTPAPSGKLSRTDFLQSRVDAAAQMCKSAIVATAKDPSSVQFDDKYAYGFGAVLTRNWIIIDWGIRGRNTYGAVLRHTMECKVSCIQGKACTFVDLTE